MISGLCSRRAGGKRVVSSNDLAADAQRTLAGKRPSRWARVGAGKTSMSVSPDPALAGGRVFPIRSCSTQNMPYVDELEEGRGARVANKRGLAVKG